MNFKYFIPLICLSHTNILDNNFRWTVASSTNIIYSLNKNSKNINSIPFRRRTKITIKILKITIKSIIKIMLSINLTLFTLLKKQNCNGMPFIFLRNRIQFASLAYFAVNFRAFCYKLIWNQYSFILFSIISPQVRW